ncbi:hypothetical protein DL98DRAFT_578486 [Cadophora sp. DSE1049]|nr:hypothetical protein DL98DRAFT_578486 [Cadophora sp. DSE1049]
MEIWRAVFDLVLLTSSKQLTPPTAFEKAVFDTLLRPSSASQRGTEQTHDENPDEDRSVKTLVQLAGYVREVFGSQPERRFVPGFTIYRSIIRLWIVDRSGAYNSEKFDIYKEPERFVKVIASYALILDAELGLNTFIRRDRNGKYIVARDVRISLEDKLIASTKAIVRRGTICYRGRRLDSTDREYVVKFAWPSNKRQQEGRLLKLANERGVTGVAEWFHHAQAAIDGSLDTIASLRKGMKFGPPRRDFEKVVEYSVVRQRPRSSDIRNQLGAACHQSRSWWSNAPRGGETDGAVTTGAERGFRRLAGVIGVYGMVGIAADLLSEKNRCCNSGLQVTPQPPRIVCPPIDQYAQPIAQPIVQPIVQPTVQPRGRSSRPSQTPNFAIPNPHRAANSQESLDMAEVIAVAASVIAVIQISDRVIELCKFYIEALVETPSSLRALLIEISTLKTIFEALHILEKCDRSMPALWTQISAPKGPIKGCRCALTALEKLFPPEFAQMSRQDTQLSKRQKVKAAFATLQWPFKQSRAKELLQQIGNYKAVIQLAITTESRLV